MSNKEKTETISTEVLNIEELNKALETSKELVKNLEMANSLLKEFANGVNDVEPKINPNGKIKSQYDVLEILLKTLEELRKYQEQLFANDLRDDYLLVTERIENLAKFLLTP